jgi:hypothetical protein
MEMFLLLLSQLKVLHLYVPTQQKASRLAIVYLRQHKSIVGVADPTILKSKIKMSTHSDGH